MKVVHSPEALPSDTRGAVVALGVFDGVHLGHQAVLSQTVRRARERRVAAGVVTFDVDPDQVLLGAEPCFLTSLEHRLRLISRLGISCALVLTFDRALSQTSAEEFARLVFREGFRAQVVVMGRGGRFGRGGAGTPEDLSRWGQCWGLAVEVVEPVTVAGEPVSSTRIRQAVRRGDLEGAQASLGRPVSVLGTVVQGEGRGRRLGFPTINLDLHHEACPCEGVYTGRADVGGRWRPAAVSVGRKPTFHPERGAGEEPVVEAHILDFAGEIEGWAVEVEFLARLREQERFPDDQALAEQIARDVAATRAFFGAGTIPVQEEREAP